MSDKYGSFVDRSSSGDSPFPEGQNDGSRKVGRSRSRMETSLHTTGDNKTVVLNAICVILLFLSWVACCVAFAAPLHLVTLERSEAGLHSSISISFYWNHYRYRVSDEEVTKSYSNCHAGSCLAGGRVLVGLSSLAFVALTVSLLLLVLRMGGRHNVLPISTNAYLSTEVGLAAVTSFFLFLMSVVWGSACFQQTSSCLNNESDAASSPHATGYAFICVCLFFILAVFAILVHVRNLTLRNTDGAVLLSKDQSSSSIPQSSSLPSSQDSSQV